MIVELLVSVFVALVRFIIGLMPTVGPPGWVLDGTGYLAAIWESAAGLGVWIPWPLVGTVVAAVFACIIVGFGIKVIRIVASFLTAGGGSAA